MPVEIVQPPERDNLLDLDAYRKKREAAGTWPVSKEDEIAFWMSWRARRKK